MSELEAAKEADLVDYLLKTMGEQAPQRATLNDDEPIANLGLGTLDLLAAAGRYHHETGKEVDLTSIDAGITIGQFASLG